MQTRITLAIGLLFTAVLGRAQEIMPTATPSPRPIITPTPSPSPWEITPGASAASASTTDGNVAANTVDNSLSSRWSGYGDGAWVRLDLGASRKLAQLRVAAYRGNERRNRFEIQLSGTGTAWRTVVTGETSGTTTAQEPFSFASQYARYVRYLGHGYTSRLDGTTGLWNSVTELDVMGWIETPTSPPPPPSQLRAFPASGRVTLTWSGPAPQFRIWRRLSQCDNYVNIGTTDGALSFVDTNVVDRRHYYYAVTGVNPVGESAASAPVAVTPQLQPPAPPIVEGSVGPPDSGEVHLGWGAVPTATRYTIKRGLAYTCGGPSPTAIATVDAPVTSYTDTTAKPGTRYLYAVSAWNTTGEGSSSINVQLTPPTSSPTLTPTPTPCPAPAPLPPPNEPPLPPASFTTQAADQRSLLTWGSQGSVYNRPTGYSVFRGPDSCGPYSQIEYHVPYGRHVDEPLVNGQTYHYFVVARNALGESLDSIRASASPQQVPPVKPSVGTVTSAPSNGPPRVTVYWQAAFANDRYVVRRAARSGGPYTTLATVPRPQDTQASYEDTTVTVGQVYYYVVVAENSLGAETSDEVMVQTGVAAPASVRAKGIVGGVTLTWSAVDGASAYNVKRRTTCSTSYTTVATVTSTTHTDLVASSSRQFYVVSAVAGTAESPDSTEVGAAPFVAPPAPPSDVRVSSATSANVTLGWSAVAGATGYRIFRRHGGADGPGCNGDSFHIAGTIRDGATTTYTDTMVSPGTRYQYEVRSVRDVRQGPASARIDVVTAGERGWPHPPLGHCFPAPTPTPAPTGTPWPPSIQWHMASHRLVRMTFGGSTGADKLNLYRGTTSCGPFELIHEPTNALPFYADPDLANDTTYTYLLAGENSFGEGRGVTTWDTPRTGPPSSPMHTLGIPGDTKARLEWSPSYSATSYVVKRSSGGEFGPYSPIGTTTTDSFVDAGLTNGVRYHYVIHAVNEHGESTFGSARITVMPISPELSPPTGVTATAFASNTTGPGFIRLQWQAPPGADSFNILRRADDEPTFEHMFTTPYTVFQDSRIFNIRYHYYVVARNGFGGRSGPSATVSAILPSPATVEVTPPASQVTASTHDGNLPGNTVDGILSTRWSAPVPAAGGEQWLEMDLGAVRTVTNLRVAVYRGDTRKNSFSVMTSRDRVRWDLQWSGYSSGTTTALQTYDVMDSSARYVRYVGSGAIANGTSDTVPWNSVTEMEVFAVP